MVKFYPEFGSFKQGGLLRQTQTGHVLVISADGQKAWSL